MKFNEIKEQLQLGVNISKLVNLKYVPVVSQKTIINNIKVICLIKDDNGFLKIDYTMRKIFELLYILSSYTDIEFEGLGGLYDKDNINSELAIEIYDYCKQYRILEFVLENSDIKDLLLTLDDEINQEIEINNSVASVLNQALIKIIDSLPSQEGVTQMISDLPKVLNSINKPLRKKTK